MLLLELTGLLLELEEELLEEEGLLLLEEAGLLLLLLLEEDDELPSMVLEGSGNSGVTGGSLLSLLENIIEPEPLMISPGVFSDDLPHPAEAMTSTKAAKAATSFFI